MSPPITAQGNGGPQEALHTERELLRFATAGSVDDGKSTLIGRLLFDSKSIFEDQLAHVEETSRRRGDEFTDLALLTDGLRAEREQGITIDVAYRYFATPKRDFIIADTPGHVQYTRNMVTGASNADLSLILVDARKGVIEQSKRHAYISSLLRVPHMVVCVNKMDLVDFDEQTFDEICADFRAFAAKLDIADIVFIPISALHGDNVVEHSERMPWYEGPAMLYHLEHVHIASGLRGTDPRLPVQFVIRPMSAEHSDYRGYAGQVAGGTLRPGDEVELLPSARGTTIEAIDTYEGEIDEAFAPMSVVVRLTENLDVSRGDMIASAEHGPLVTREIEADVCWMADAPMRPGARYQLKHTTRTARAVVDSVRHRVDIESLEADPDADELGLNDIGRVTIRTSAPLAVDEYRHNRATGSFILIDEAQNTTVGAGMITGA